MFIISFHRGFVAGFSRAMQVVQSTSEKSHAKTFRTEVAAQKFINTYSNAGYGMAKEDCTIVPVRP